MFWFYYASTGSPQNWTGTVSYLPCYGLSVRLVYATIQGTPCSISVSANPSTGGTVSGGGSYQYGSNCTVTATANSGCIFSSWTENGNEVSTSASYSFTVTGNRTLVANFVILSGGSHESVDLGLPSGTLWATCNVGADTPEGYGNYFAWGETQLKDNHFWSNYEHCMGTSRTLTKYCNKTNYGNNGFTDDLTVLLPEDDAAAFYWDEDWRMPTKEEFEELYNNTTVTYTTQNGVHGCLFTASNGNSVFLPASGYRQHYDHFDVGYSGHYWSSSLDTGNPSESWFFYLNSDEYNFACNNYCYERYWGLTVRPVRSLSQNLFSVTVSANPSNVGSVSGGGTFHEGYNCTVTATANPGYIFTNWTENGNPVSTNASYTFTVTGNRNLVANFEEMTQYIQFDLNDSYGDGWTGNYLVVGYGNRVSEQLTISSGSSASYMLPIPDGSHVTLTWIMGSYPSDCSFTVSYPNGNVIYTGANMNASFMFEFDVDYNGMPTTSFGISVSANPSAGGSVNGAGNYNCGSSCTVTATANSNYTFTNWTENGNQVSTSATYSFTVTGDRTLVANFEATAFTQSTTHPEGWSWWSSYIELDGIDGLAQMETSLGSSGVMIKSRNDGFVTNYGSVWVGSLLSVNNENTYLIQTNAACTMEVTGNMAVAASHPITLPSGWSWIGYPCGTPMSVGTALSGLTPSSNDQIKSREGFAVYYPGAGWLGTLSTLTPGMGLMFESHNSATVTLTYPDAAKSDGLKENITARDNHWQPAMQGYPDNMSVVAVVELDGAELQGEHYEIAAFANGECRGSARLMRIDALNRCMAFLTVYGEGAAELRFGLYDAVTGDEVFSSDDHLTFAANATSGNPKEPFALSFRSLTGTDEWGSSLHVYPNPVQCGQTLSLGLAGETGRVEVEIVNALGAVVATCHGVALQTLTAPNIPGIYTLRITAEGQGTQIRKLIVK